MSYIGTKDFLIEVQKGNVAGHSMVHKFGRNATVTNSWEIVSNLGNGWNGFRTSAATMRVKAGGDANDTAAGSGAREITIQGIDSSFNETSEAVATAGASASSATTTSFWRVHRAWVSAAGTYGGANAAAVTIEDSGGAGDMIQIAHDGTAGEGQTQFAGWTVPTGKTAYLLGLHLHVDTGQTDVSARVFTRDNIDDTSAPMDAKRLKLFFDGVAGDLSYVPRGPELSVSAKSDIWVEAFGPAGGSQVSADFELLVVDD